MLTFCPTGSGTASVPRCSGRCGAKAPCPYWSAPGPPPDWAIRFYRRHGFELVSPARKTALLNTYWSIPERQIETSVVLANPPIGEP